MESKSAGTQTALSYALFHQLSTEGQTSSQMQRKPADRLQKTDAVHFVLHTGVQCAHSFKKAESLSAVVLSAVTWC